LEVTHAADDDVNGIGSFTLSGGTKPVTMKQSSYIGAKFDEARGLCLQS
jgi:hypothetical protein